MGVGGIMAFIKHDEVVKRPQASCYFRDTELGFPWKDGRWTTELNKTPLE